MMIYSIWVIHQPSMRMIGAGMIDCSVGLQDISIILLFIILETSSHGKTADCFGWETNTTILWPGRESNLERVRQILPVA